MDLAMSYKLILLSELKPEELKMVVVPTIAINIIRELHFQQTPTPIWELELYHDPVAMYSSPEHQYDGVINKLSMGYILLLEWPSAHFDGVIDHTGKINPMVHMSGANIGMDNRLLLSKVKALQKPLLDQQNHSPSAESKSSAQPISSNKPVQPAIGRTIQNAVANVMIEFQLLDHDGTPMANSSYLVTLASGDEITGTLDPDGYAMLTGEQYKNAKVTFPDFHAGDWK